MRELFIIFVILLTIIFIFIGCEGPVGPQGPQGPAGTSEVWIHGSIYANSTYNPYGKSYISVYNTTTIPQVTLNSMEYIYDGDFSLEFAPLSPGENAHITVDGINLDGDSIHSYSDIIVPGPIDFYNESSNDTIYITLGEDALFIWNNANNSKIYELYIYIYYYYEDTSGLYTSYSFNMDTMLTDTSFTITSNTICPNIGEISEIINTSGYCWVSASNGPLYTGDTSNVYGDGAGFIKIDYYSNKYNIQTLLGKAKK